MPLAQSTSPESNVESKSIFLAIILIAIIIGAIVANFLICLAFGVVRELRKPHYYLVVSLAVTDLCVSMMMIPAVAYTVLDEWNFSSTLCDIWIFLDQLTTTASILNLCAISIDRYWIITKPLEYCVKRTSKRMMLYVALIWLGAALVSLPPPLIASNAHYDHGQRICLVSQNIAYQIYATLIAFYIPYAVMVFVYSKIFRASQRIALAEKQTQIHLESLANADVNDRPVKSSPHHSRIRLILAQEFQSTAVLGCLVVAFTICWLPFFVLAVIRPFIGSSAVPDAISSLFLWLGYLNSLLNPVIQATLFHKFRVSIHEILCCRRSKLDAKMREMFYQQKYGVTESNADSTDNFVEIECL